MKPLPSGFKWDQNSTLLFQQAMCNPETTGKLEALIKCPYSETQQGVEYAVGELNEVLLTAAKLSLRPLRKRKPPKPNKKWFGGNLVRFRREVAKQGRLMTMFPHDPWIRGTYHSTLREYRKSYKQEFQRFKQDTLSQLDELQNSDPGAYWRLIKTLGRTKNKIGKLIRENSSITMCT